MSAKTSDVKRKFKQGQRNPITPYIFLAPSFILLAIFFYGPFAFSIGASFTDWTLLGRYRSFVGLANYITVLSDNVFWISMRNTLVYTIFYLVGINVMALLIANGLVGFAKKYRQLMSAVFFIPYVCSMVAVTVMWNHMYQPSYGILNFFLRSLGFQPLAWLTDGSVVLWSVAMMTIWRDTGFFVIIYIAGLLGISQVYYEAARVDGASALQRFRSITLPMLANTTFFNTVFAVIVALQMFDQAWILTRGGPGFATRTVVIHLYQTAFAFYRMGEGSANAIILFFLIMILTLIRIYFNKRIEE